MIIALPKYNILLVVVTVSTNDVTVNSKCDTYTQFAIEIVCLVDPADVLVSTLAQDVDFYAVLLEFSLIRYINLLQSRLH